MQSIIILHECNVYCRCNLTSTTNRARMRTRYLHLSALYATIRCSLLLYLQFTGLLYSLLHKDIQVQTLILRIYPYLYSYLSASLKYEYNYRAHTVAVESFRNIFTARNFDHSAPVLRTYSSHMLTRQLFLLPDYIQLWPTILELPRCFDDVWHSISATFLVLPLWTSPFLVFLNASTIATSALSAILRWPTDTRQSFNPVAHCCACAPVALRSRATTLATGRSSLPLCRSRLSYMLCYYNCLLFLAISLLIETGFSPFYWTSQRCKIYFEVCGN